MDSSKSIVKISDLKTTVDAILSHITDDLGIDSIELDQDLYWEIPEGQLYVLNQNPGNHTMGSLFDDLEFLQPLLTDRDRALSLMLLHVAPLLRYLALKIGQ